MIKVVGYDITVAGSHEYKVIQLGILIQHYLDNDITVINDVINQMADNVDISFHDCYFRRWEGSNQT